MVAAHSAELRRELRAAVDVADAASSSDLVEGTALEDWSWRLLDQWIFAFELFHVVHHELYDELEQPAGVASTATASSTSADGGATTLLDAVSAAEVRALGESLDNLTALVEEIYVARADVCRAGCARRTYTTSPNSTAFYLA